MEPKRKAALVLSSGGARGNAHMGVLEVLDARGFEITSITGSSMGAMVGGVYACGKLSEFKDWMCNLDKLDVFRLMDFTLSSHGIMKGDKVFNTIRKIIGDPNIEDLSIPFKAIASDIVNQCEVVFDKGNMLAAIRASSGFPTVLTPVHYNGGELVDGGVLNPLPIDKISNNEHELVIAVNLNAYFPDMIHEASTEELKEREDNKKKVEKSIQKFTKKWDALFPAQKKDKDDHLGFFSILSRSFEVAQNKITEATIKTYKPEIVINLSRETCDTFEFYRASEMIIAGREAANQAINQYLKMKNA